MWWENNTRGTRPGIDRRRFLGTVGGAAALAVGAGRVAASSPTDYTIESFDGTELAATLYPPADGGPGPAVLLTHGWGLNRTAEPTVRTAERYADEGYAALAYDSRGFGDSDGTVTINGPNEVRDAQRLVDWLADRPGVATDGPDNPRLGMDGISYAGGIQWLLAATDDRVDAIVPRIAWHDLRYSLAPNGVIKADWLTALLGFGTFGTVRADPGTWLDRDFYEWYFEGLATKELPDDAAAAFRERSLVSNLDGFDTPALIVQGWDDTLFKPTEGVRAYRALRERDVPVRVAFYEGGHLLSAGVVEIPDAQQEYATDRAVRWLDRHVRGRDTDVPGAAQYLKQRGEWRTDDRFPPAGVSAATYDLADADRDGSPTIEQFSFRHGKTVTYRWSVDEDIEVVGTPTLDLSVTADRDDTAVFVALEHDGEPINGLDEAYRIEDGGDTTLRFEYPALQRFLAAGDRLGLSISVSRLDYLEPTAFSGLTVHEADSRLHLPQRQQ